MKWFAEKLHPLAHLPTRHRTALLQAALAVLSIGIGVVIGRGLAWIAIAVAVTIILLLGSARYLANPRTPSPPARDETRADRTTLGGLDGTRTPQAGTKPHSVGLALRPEVRVVTRHDYPAPRTVRQFRTYIAQVVVHNKAERGGDEATVRAALPEYWIYSPDGKEIFRYKGWDQASQRDFTARQEEHALPVAQVRDGQLAVSIPPADPSFVMSGARPFKIRVTVRAENIDPVTGWFDLLVRPDGQTGLALVDADAIP